MAIAKHNPEKLYERNQGLMAMAGSDMEDYAKTPEKDLPTRAKGNDKRQKRGRR